VNPARAAGRRAVAGLCVVLALASWQASAGAPVLGTHVHDLGTREPWPPPGFTSVRLWDARVTWADLEPAPND
jgi:hypothetical protein